MITTQDSKSMELLSRNACTLTNKLSVLLKEQQKITGLIEKSTLLSEDKTIAKDKEPPVEENILKNTIKSSNTFSISVQHPETVRSTSRNFDEETFRARNKYPTSNEMRTIELNITGKTKEQAEEISKTQKRKIQIPKFKKYYPSITNFQNYMEKLKKCDNLKGEILLKDQKKKFAVNKTYDPLIAIPKSIFYREKRDSCTYERSYKHSKINLFLKSNKFKGFTSNSTPAGEKENEQSRIAGHMKSKSMINLFPTCTSNLQGIGLSASQRKSNEKKSRNRTLLLRKISDINAQAIEESHNFLKSLDSKIKHTEEELETDQNEQANRYKEISQKCRLKELGKGEVNEENIFDQHMDSILSKSKNSHAEYYIRQVFAELDFENRHLIKFKKKHVPQTQNHCCLSESKMYMLKLGKAFKKVAIESIILDNRIHQENCTEPKNEGKLINKMIANMNAKKWTSTGDLQELISKKNIMKDVKPLIYQKIRTFTLEKEKRKEKVNFSE